jgi:uncharacterized protein (DUF1499 family)
MSKVRDVLVWLAVLVALAVPVYFAYAALGTKFGLHDWTFGFGQLTYQWGAKVMMGAAGFAVLALIVAYFTPPRRGVMAALLALLIPAGGLGYGAYVRHQAQDIPPIHDISTDLEDPPAFSEAVVQARGESANGLDLVNKTTRDGAHFIDLQVEAYPDIESIPTGLTPDAAFDVADALVREQSWSVGLVDREGGSIEAMAESFWYGFKDDIVVRVTPDGAGARIDMRSVSRVGGSDLGANSARMGPFLESLRGRIAEAEAAAVAPEAEVEQTE